MWSALLSHALFIAVRFFKQQQTFIWLSNSDSNCEKDFLEARHVEVGVLTCWMTPLWCSFSIILHWQAAIKLDPKTLDLVKPLTVITLFQFLQVLCGLILFFTNNHKGWSSKPRCRNCWFTAGPIFQHVLGIFCFFIAPLTYLLLIPVGPTIFSPVFYFFGVTSVGSWLLYFL